MRLLLLPTLAATLYAQVDTPYRVPVPAPETPDRIVARYEQPLRDLARQWIHDSSLANRTWAAILLRRYRDPSLDKDLVDDLREASGRMLSPRGEPIPESELHYLRLTIMDALIVNGTGIPEDLAFSLFPRYPAQAVILLLRSSRRVETCVRLLNSALADEVWLVAASCLSDQPGGPVELLRRVPMRVRIQALNLERGSGLAGTPGGPVPGSGLNYELSTGYWLGATPLILGPHPVYYQKTTVEWNQSAFWLQHGDRNQYTLDILARHILSRNYAVMPPLDLSPHLRWITTEQFLTDLRVLVADEQERYERLLTTMISRHYMTPAEGSTLPQAPEFELVDSRIDRRLSLPTVMSDGRVQ